MDVTKFYWRNKISKSVCIKKIAYDSDDSELSSDSDTEKRIFSISSAKNKIIPETDSERDDEAVHNGTHQETLQLDIEVKKKKPCAAPVPVHEIRTDKTGHWPTFTEKRGRCKKPNCVSIPKVICTKYKVHLCFTPSSNCFMEFHKSNQVSHIM
jgi:hypothetical protein